MITILVSIISGLMVNNIRRGRVPVVPEYIGNESIKHTASLPLRFQGFEGLLIDARPNHLFNKCRFPRAVNFPADNFDFFYGLHFSKRSKDVRLFIFGRTYSHAYDEKLAHRLFLKGHRNITVVPLDLFCLK